MPKKLVKLPLVEPMKFFALPDASVSAECESQESVTNRIIQHDQRRSLVARGKTGASKGEIDQTHPGEHNLVPGARRGEKGERMDLVGWANLWVQEHSVRERRREQAPEG